MCYVFSFFIAAIEASADYDTMQGNRQDVKGNRVNNTYV